jgi:deazaflavin-dependent oxidoreductase (nitroreductase family)
MTHAPAVVRLPGPIVRRLLGAGFPMGPNVVLTVRGRTSGQPRSAPVAMVGAGGRRWIVGTFGRDPHWVKNLRAAGEADISFGGRTEHVEAIELSRDEAEQFFRDTLGRCISELRLHWRVFTRIFLRIAAPVTLKDPEAAALTRPVFELRRPI